METQTREATFFLSQPPKLVDTGAARIPYRVYGSGEAVLFIHGWPFWGFGYRKILPRLAEKYACYVIDLPGAGFSEWDAHNDFSFHGHAANVKRLLDKLDLPSYRIIAHDTGATVARRLAIIDPERAKQLALINTEIPHHRPPLVPLFQKLMALPGANLTFRMLLKSRRFRRSAMGFGGCFVDMSLIEGDFHQHFVVPLYQSPERMAGQILYARGIEWAQLDALAEGHRQIKGSVLLLWGERDPFFPIAEARPMVSQFADCRGLIPIADCRLLPHEERPEVVTQHILEFFA